MVAEAAGGQWWLGGREGFVILLCSVAQAHERYGTRRNTLVSRKVTARLDQDWRPPGATRVPPTTAQAVLRTQPAMRHLKPLARPPYQRLLFNFIDFNNMR